MTGMADPEPNLGAALLMEWRKDKRKILQSEACAILGIDPAAYCALERGRRIPGLERAAHIEKVTGVPPRTWLEPAPAKRITRKRAA